MEKTLATLELQLTKENLPDFWLEDVKFRNESQLLTTTRKDKWIVDSNVTEFYKILQSYYDDTCNTCDDIFDTYVFNFLTCVSKYNGYVYGSIVYDFLVPVLVYGQDINEMSFTTICVWFQNKNDSDNFIGILNQGILKLLKGSDENSYEFYFKDNKTFPVQINISPKLPVDDLSINLLLFKAKQLDFNECTLSWFSVGENLLAENKDFTVKDLMIQIDTKCTSILSGHLKCIEYQYPKYENFKKMLICMKSNGWTFQVKHYPLERIYADLDMVDENSKIIKYKHIDNHYFNNDNKYVFRWNENKKIVVGKDKFHCGLIEQLTIEEKNRVIKNDDEIELILYDAEPYKFKEGFYFIKERNFVCYHNKQTNKVVVIGTDPLNNGTIINLTQHDYYGVHAMGYTC